MLRIGDRACLFAFALFALLLTGSLVLRPAEPPVARYICVNGTAYFLSKESCGLTFSRQSASPESVGPLVVNVETLNLIDVHDNGEQLPGMELVRPERRWVPAMDSEVVGWYRGGNALSGVGMFGPRSIFRVQFQTLTLPTPFLLLMTILSAMPLARSWRGQHGRGKSTTVGRPAAA